MTHPFLCVLHCPGHAACHALEDDGPFPYSLDLLPYDVDVFGSLRKTLKNHTCRFRLEEEGMKVWW
jgi:hypothetical protein